MMGLREFVELFDKNEVKNLFNALSLCIEYVRNRGTTLIRSIHGIRFTGNEVVLRKTNRDSII